VTEKDSLLWNRRSVLRHAAGVSAGAITTALLGLDSASAEAGTVYVNSWGGLWTDAEKVSFYEPFTKATGIRVQPVIPLSFAKLKAEVQSRNYQFDVTNLSVSDFLRATKEGLIDPIDWSVIQKDKLFPGAVFRDLGLLGNVGGTALVYRTDKYQDGPKSWADFWDVKKFPGNRAMWREPIRVVVFATLADGVPIDKVYPIDLDRAFRKLDEIKPHIRVWYQEGNQAMQLIRDGEVDMIMLWNSRVPELIKNKIPVDVVWNGAYHANTVWGVAKGAPNAKFGWQFAEFTTYAPGQAEFARLLSYAPSNPESYNMLEPDVAKWLVGYKDNGKHAIWGNPDWEVANIDRLEERFNDWLSK